MNTAPPQMPDLPGMDPKTAAYLRRTSTWAKINLQSKVDKDQAAASLLLLSPGGKVFALSVNDSGVVQTTPVALGSNP